MHACVVDASLTDMLTEHTNVLHGLICTCPGAGREGWLSVGPGRHPPCWSVVSVAAGRVRRQAERRAQQRPPGYDLHLPHRHAGGGFQAARCRVRRADPGLPGWAAEYPWDVLRVSSDTSFCARQCRRKRLCTVPAAQKGIAT